MGKKEDNSIKAGFLIAKKQMEEKAGKGGKSSSRGKGVDQEKFLKKIKSKKEEKRKVNYDVKKLTRITRFPEEIDLSAVLEVAKDNLWKNSKDMVMLNVAFASLILLKEYKKANYEYKKGLNIDRNNTDLNYNLAELYFRINEHDKALETLKWLLSKDNNDLESVYLMALIHYVKNEINEAITIIAKYLNSDEEFSRVHKNYTFLSLIKLDIEKAKELLIKLLEQEKTNINSRIALAHLYLDQSKIDEYKKETKILEKSIGQGSVYAPCFYVNRAIMFRKSGDLKKAKEELGNAKAEYNKCICSEVELIKVLVKNKEYEKAYLKASEAIGIDHTFVPLLVEVFRLYYYLRKDKEVESLYTRLISIYPNIIIRFFNKEKTLARVRLSDLKDNVSLKIKGILNKYEKMQPDFELEAGSEMIIYNLFRDVELCHIKYLAGGGK